MDGCFCSRCLFMLTRPCYTDHFFYKVMRFQGYAVIANVKLFTHTEKQIRIGQFRFAGYGKIATGLLRHNIHLILLFQFSHMIFHWVIIFQCLDYAKLKIIFTISCPKLLQTLIRALSSEKMKTNSIKFCHSVCGDG